MSVTGINLIIIKGLFRCPASLSTVSKTNWITELPWCHPWKDCETKCVPVDTLPRLANLWLWCRSDCSSFSPQVCQSTAKGIPRPIIKWWTILPSGKERLCFSGRCFFRLLYVVSRFHAAFWDESTNFPTLVSLESAYSVKPTFVVMVALDE